MEHEDKQLLRPSIFEGTFYPAHPKTLENTVEKLLQNVAENKSEKTPRLLIVPHAGYIYSGKTAAHAYKLIQNKNYKRVILIGPAHRFSVPHISVYPKGTYFTPLGPVDIDSEYSQKLLQWDYADFILRAHWSEHALEVQLPFLQMTLDDFSIVPILTGENSIGMARGLARKLLSLQDSQSTLYIASSDLSHYHTIEACRRKDTKTIEYIKEMKSDIFMTAIKQKTIEACGATAITVLIELAKLLKLSAPEVLDISNSGEVTHDTSRVVGYVSAAFYDN